MENNTVTIEIIIAVIGAISSIIVALISSLIGHRNLKKEMGIELNKFRLENTYQIKKEAIFESLQIIDSTLSCHNFSSNITPLRDPEIKSLELTKNARTVYNKLIITCENSNLPNIFIKIVCGNEANKLNLYVEYRKACRTELGLKEINVDEDRVFISFINTEESTEK